MAQQVEPSELLPRSPSRRGTEEPVEVRRYLDAIRRSRSLIAGIVVLLTGVVVGVSLSLPDRYEATASIVKEVSSQPFDNTSIDVVTRELNTIGQLLTTRNVLNAAAKKLPGETGDTLADKVSSSVDPNANLISVNAEAGDARSAARIANTVAQTFVSEQADVDRRQIEAARANLLDELNRL